MNSQNDNDVRNFILNELPLVTTLFLKKIKISDDVTLQQIYEADDLSDIAEKYFLHFRVLPGKFYPGKYFPLKEKSSLFGRGKIPVYEPLTINMFI